MNNSYKIIGKPLPRKDGKEIVTGAVNFLNDLKFGNLLFGKVLRSPFPHANIKNIDKTEAEKIPGVHAVLTWKDVPDWKGGTPRHVRVLDKKVRYAGDAAALIAAESEDIAEEAAEHIHVEYEELPAVYDVEEALKPGAPQLYDEFPSNILTPGTPIFGPECLYNINKGDIQKGFEEADYTAEGTFGYENIPNPVPPEPPGAIALWEDPDKVTLWVSNQAPYMDKITLFHVFNREVEVRTIGNPCGGSFGTKVVSWQIQAYATLLSRATGRPVKLIYSKEEHLSSFTLRPGSRMHARIGLKKDGSISAISGRWLVNTGYYSMTTQAQVAVGCGEIMIMSQCLNWDLKSTVVCTNRNASGCVRGFGGQELKSAFIPLLSLAMQQGGLDPFYVLKKNFVKPGQGYFWRDGKWYTYRGINFSNAMDKGAEVFGWKEKWKGWMKPSAESGPLKRGIGVGIHGNADIGEDSSEAYVKLLPDGTATLYLCVAEHGTGQRSNYIKMVAEVLNLPYEKVNITPPDSLINPFEFGPVGSRGTYAIGGAAINAAEDAKMKLFELFAKKLNTSPQNLATENGIVFVRGNTQKKLKWNKMGGDRTIIGYGRFEEDFTLSNCVMSFVEVEVDTETGKTDLIRVVNATDVGKIIDPPGLEGQLNGCLGSGGIDSALFEETVIDIKNGNMLNSNMTDYRWRTFSELPAMDNVIFETPAPSHQFHAIGVGEISTAPGPPAVLMAVSNAIGKWIHSYPVNPEKILRTIGMIH
ncbi:MAG: xanthine dehydrogenase family protein molybdopterin-binding subunit [Spirochaetes bacterium]|nr:xanthine dehydrogenase family protein molybdopterin-binding subunit [Spirochaetota bacterium]